MFSRTRPLASMHMINASLKNKAPIFYVLFAAKHWNVAQHWKFLENLTIDFLIKKSFSVALLKNILPE